MVPVFAALGLPVFAPRDRQVKAGLRAAISRAVNFATYYARVGKGRVRLLTATENVLDSTVLF